MSDDDNYHAFSSTHDSDERGTCNGRECGSAGDIHGEGRGRDRKSGVVVAEGEVMVVEVVDE